MLVKCPASSRDRTPCSRAQKARARWEGVAPHALVRYRTETVIHAPLRTIGKLQTDVERWPYWQDAVAALNHEPGPDPRRRPPRRHVREGRRRGNPWTD